MLVKIGVDAFGCDHGRSGIGTYLHSFVAHIPRDCGCKFELFGSPLDRYTYTSRADFPFRALPVSDSEAAERWWHLSALPAFAREAGYDAALYPSVERALPFSFKTPGVAVVNSVISARKTDGNAAIGLVTRMALSRAQRVVAPSRYVRKNLAQLGIPAQKIIVIHNGIDHQLFYPQMDALGEEPRIKPFAVKRPYFIYGSRVSGPDKKHVELIRAFALFKERTRLPHRLVLAGDEGAGSEAARAEIARSSAASSVFLTGFFPRETFPMLYASADACVFPAVNEGSGLPVLEAMATGIPVACAKSGALPEMAGKAALYFDSDNIEEMADAMEKVATDLSLRETMVKAGLGRTKKFNWDDTVIATIEVLRQVAEERGD